MPESSDLRLIDSSAWICFLRKAEPLSVFRRVDGLLEAHTVLTLPVVRIEILQGARNEGEFIQLYARFSRLPSLPLDEPVCEQAESLGFNLRRKGVSVAVGDLLIAAAAITARVALVHADSDFDVIARHSALRVESFAKGTRK